MTDKELRKLGRAELLEIMYELRKQLDEALQENEKLCAELSEFRSSLTAQTNKMVSRLYEDRFGEPFEFKEPEAVSDKTEEQSDGQEDHCDSDN